VKRPPLGILAVGALMSAASGCFNASTHQALPGTSRPPLRAQVLPVLAAQVRITMAAGRGEFVAANGKGTDKEEAAEACNTALEDLLRAKTAPFQPPSHLTEAQSAELSERMEVYLRDPGSSQEGWKREGLRAIAESLGVPSLVLVHLSIEQREPLDLSESGRAERRWTGVAHAEASLFALVPSRVVAIGSGEAEFHGRAGVVLIGMPAGVVIPYAFGKGFPPAVESALRTALAELDAKAPRETP